MFDISALKEMKLAELQEIAKLAKTIKITGVKKETLISQILAHQESTNAPAQAPQAEVVSEAKDEKPKRARIAPAKTKATNTKNAPVLEFDEVEETVQKNDTVETVQPIAEKADEAVEENKTPIAKKEPKGGKFNKQAYEKKVAQKKEKEVTATEEVVETAPSESITSEPTAETAEKTSQIAPAKRSIRIRIKIRTRTRIKTRIRTKIRTGMAMETEITIIKTLTTRIKRTIITSEIRILNLTELLKVKAF